VSLAPALSEEERDALRLAARVLLRLAGDDPVEPVAAVDRIGEVERELRQRAAALDCFDDPVPQRVAAELLGIAPARLRAAARRGKIDAATGPGQPVAFRMLDLAEYAMRQGLARPNRG
jgi:hypothetical protein